MYFMKRKKENSIKSFNREDKILFTVLIVLFMMLNYSIVAYGHKLTYDLETNNCTHMSQRLEDMLESFGIPVTLVTGTKSSGDRHMWISLWDCIEFDSVNLLPFQNAQFNLQHIEYRS